MHEQAFQSCPVSRCSQHLLHLHPSQSCSRVAVQPRLRHLHPDQSWANQHLSAIKRSRSQMKIFLTSHTENTAAATMARPSNAFPSYGPMLRLYSQTNPFARAAAGSAHPKIDPIIPVSKGWQMNCPANALHTRSFGCLPVNLPSKRRPCRPSGWFVPVADFCHRGSPAGGTCNFAFEMQNCT
jgi:hypothetical protein